MREATMTVLSLSITCPYCYEPVRNSKIEVLPYRTTHWLPKEIGPGQAIRCDLCGKDFTLPVNDERIELNW